MLAFLLFIIFIPKIVICGYGYGDYDGIPKPVMTLHDGHINLYEELLVTEYSGNIRAGQPYTLDIYMGNTDRYDYVIEKCFYNSRLSFLDNYGCLRKDNFFQEKWETDQYYMSNGALKRTLVHFIAPEPVAKFECQIKVIECCGCAEQSCERQPIIIKEKTFVIPLMCSYPLNPPIGGGAYPYGGGGGGYGGYGGYWGFWNVIPWWLWLLILLLFFILLLLICCAICFCVFRRKGSRHRTYPPPAALPPPIAPKPQIIKNDEGVQAFPETRQKSQQVDLENERRAEEEFARQRQLSRFDAVSLVDYPPKHEPKTVVHTIYANEETEYRDRRREHEHREFEEYGLDQEYVNLGPPSRNNYHHSYEDERRQDEFRRYGGVALHRGATSYQHQQLQQEIEEHLRREHERQELEERIESHLSEHRERRHYAASPSGETMREETVRTLRQSSVI